MSNNIKNIIICISIVISVISIYISINTLSVYTSTDNNLNLSRSLDITSKIKKLAGKLNNISTDNYLKFFNNNNMFLEAISINDMCVLDCNQLLLFNDNLSGLIKYTYFKPNISLSVVDIEKTKMYITIAMQYCAAIYKSTEINQFKQCSLQYIKSVEIRSIDKNKLSQ